MPYIPWDENSPSGSDPANELDTFIQEVKEAVRERMVSLGVTNWASADPVTFAALLMGGVTPYFRGSSTTTSIQFQSKDGLNVNLELFENGNITVRGTLTADGLAISGAFSFTDLVTFEDDVTFEGTSTFEANLIVDEAQIHTVLYDNGNFAGGLSHTINLDNGNNQEFQYSGPGTATVAFTNPKEGALYTLKFNFGGGGGVLSLANGVIKYPGGVTPTWTPSSNPDIIQLMYSAPFYYMVSLAQDLA